ncbi:MAG: D-Ala-D-Ala carboxypeptidase family metallohydrolase [Polyangiaceae bacterium]
MARRITTLFQLPLLAATLASSLWASSSHAKSAPAEPWWLPSTNGNWVLGQVVQGRHHRLASERELPLLRRFIEPSVERHGEWRGFWLGKFGPSQWLRSRLAWSTTMCETEASLSASGVSLRLVPSLNLSTTSTLSLGTLGPALGAQSPEPELDETVAAPEVRCKPWEKPYAATFARYGGEHDTIRLLECDGSVALDALDRLSVIARPPNTPRPELPLPLEPVGDSALGEWLPEVRLLDPRLVWAVARLSATFPNRVIYVISGYRRQAHDGLHHKGRALDLFVMGMPNEDVFRACRRMKDVGCGYYPHNRFVHIDVRAPFTGHALWIDASKPGEATRYVDSWPGVVTSGALNFGNDSAP